MTNRPILTAAEVQHYARFEQLVASHEALRAERDAALAERDRLQHFVDCADAPMMREVLAERDAAREREKQLAEALTHVRQWIETGCDHFADDAHVVRYVDEILAARSPGGQADQPEASPPENVVEENAYEADQPEGETT